MIETPVETAVPLGLDKHEEAKVWRIVMGGVFVPSSHPLFVPGERRVANATTSEAAAWQFLFALRDIIQGAPVVSQIPLVEAICLARAKGWTLILRDETLKIIDRWEP